MQYIIFDTETTGLPRKYKAPIHDVHNWPRIVQLAWLLANEDGEIQAKGNHIVKPNGFQIPSGMVHGISTKQAIKEGVPINAVLDDFLSDLQDSDAVVCHNYDFDAPILGAEFFRLCQPNPIAHRRAFCTQNQTIDWAEIPDTDSRREKFKRPSLSQLYKICMGEEFTGAHDAMADVYATARCFFHIKQHSPGVFAFPYR